jgi:cytochrome oxidase Cu insertion factor (SCO1/SenC/PrrC family)
MNYMNYRMLFIVSSFWAPLAPTLSAPVAMDAGPPRYQALSQFGGDFSLTDAQGRPFSLRDSRGKVVLIYFGFTSCNSTCPVTLAAVAAAMRSLGPLADRVQPLFITVDPKRDTPDVLREYLPHFHPSILGLRGTQEQVTAVAEQYRAPLYVRKPDEKGDYVVDHGSYLYVVGPDGGLANLVRLGDPAEKIVRVVRGLLQPVSPGPVVGANLSVEAQ